MSLVGGADEILFQLAVGIGVGADAEAASGVDDAISAEGHAAAEHSPVWRNVSGSPRGPRLSLKSARHWAEK